MRRVAMTVRVAGRRMLNWEDFHSEFDRTFGFFPGYGRNLDAWFDCMVGLDTDFSEKRVAPGELVEIIIDDWLLMQHEAPEILAFILEGCASINGGRAEGAHPPLLIASYGQSEAAKGLLLKPLCSSSKAEADA